MGYTEPDPREDLNGMDVAKKLLILVREAGYKIEMEDIKTQNLIPEAAREVDTVNKFFSLLEKHDHHFYSLNDKARGKNRVLRYVAYFEQGKAEVALKEFENNHPFFHLQGNDNMLAIYTEHYNDSPLIIRGPGSGAEVTAAGVLADVLRIAQYLS